MHEHEHTHSVHDHHDVPVSALLHHMVEHNRSHLAELEELAKSISGEAGEKVLAAAATIREGNEQLSEALKMLEEK